MEVHLKQRSLGCQNIDQFLMAVQTLTPPQGLMEMAIFSSLTFLIHEVLDDLTQRMTDSAIFTIGRYRLIGQRKYRL